MTKVYSRDDGVKEVDVFELATINTYLNDLANKIIKTECQGCTERYCRSTIYPIKSNNPFSVHFGIRCPVWDSRNEE